MKATAFAIGAACILISGNCYAQAGFYLPSATPSSGQDEFRAADGTTCRSTMDGTKRVEVGTFSHSSQNPNYGYYNSYSTVNNSRSLQGNLGVYGRVSVSIDARQERMDCNKLFELELERRRLEVEIMKRSLLSADRDLDLQRKNHERPTVQDPNYVVEKADLRTVTKEARKERPQKYNRKSEIGIRMAPL